MHLFPRKPKKTPGAYYFGEFDDQPLAPFSISMATFDRDSYQVEPKHYHQHNQKVFVVLEGSGVLEVNGQAIAMNPEQMIQVEPGEVHRVLQVSSEKLTFMVILASKTNDKVVVTD